MVEHEAVTQSQRKASMSEKLQENSHLAPASRNGLDMVAVASFLCRSPIPSLFKNCKLQAILLPSQK
jgi:hypothetical protein